ncbi:MAG: hypothetical protein RLN86_10990 [Cyclobacteriaceae bacterium]
MKTCIHIILCIFLTSTVASANDKYEQAMLQQIEAVYKSQSNEELQNVINTFERIGSAEKSKWEPFYYASFGYVMMATREENPTTKDSYLDKAEEFLKQAEAILPKDSEMATLQGFIYTMRLTVDPATRGQQYSGLAMQALSKAVELNPENPRALGLMAQMQLGSARFFKAPITEACETAKVAIEKYDAEAPTNPLAPRWGRPMTESVIRQCQ